MATCGECIHHKSCFNMAFRCGYKAEALEGAETCEDFKNKADFVEVVRCDDCYLQGCCVVEDTFNTARMADSMKFCAVGKRRDT